MLLQLMPNQIHPYWDDIKEGMSRAIPIGVSDRDVKVLQKLLLGVMQMWVSYRPQESNKVVAGVLTALIEDQVHDTLNLLIYALWTVDESRKEDWLEGLEALKKFAQSKGCNRIIAHTEVTGIIRLVETTGGEAKYRLVSWDI